MYNADTKTGGLVLKRFILFLIYLWINSILNVRLPIKKLGKPYFTATQITVKNGDESAVQDWNTKGIGNPELEEKVTEYLIDNISFCLIPLTDKKQIRKLEQTLLEILSIHNRLHHETTGKYIQTDNWLGNYCKENQRVMESGMWNDEHIG